MLCAVCVGVGVGSVVCRVCVGLAWSRYRRLDILLMCLLWGAGAEERSGGCFYVSFIHQNAAFKRI